MEMMPTSRLALIAALPIAAACSKLMPLRALPVDDGGITVDGGAHEVGGADTSADRNSSDAGPDTTDSGIPERPRMPEWYVFPYAGTGAPTAWGSYGFGGDSRTVRLNRPAGITRSFAGTLFISISEDNRVLMERSGELRLFSPPGTSTSANLLINASAEDRLGIGGSAPTEHQRWAVSEGEKPWLQLRPGPDCPVPMCPQPFDGSRYFSAGENADSTLVQTVIVGGFAPGGGAATGPDLSSLIDSGIMRFEFSAYARSRSGQTNADVGRIRVEYLRADPTRNPESFSPPVVFDSGSLSETSVWSRVHDLRTAPVGTRFIRVSLQAIRVEAAQPNHGAFFDALSLITADGTAPRLHGPHGIVNADTPGSPANSVIVANTYDHTIVKLTESGSSSTIERLIGVSGTPGSSTTTLNAPTAVSVDEYGNIYIADYGNHRVMRLAPGASEMTLVAGTGVPGWSGDDRPATEAQLNYPIGVTMTAGGNLLIAERGNNIVRLVFVPEGGIQTFAGSGAFGNTGDGGYPLGATFRTLDSIALGPDTYFYVSDVGSHNVRRFRNFNLPITTILGNGAPNPPDQIALGDGGPAILAQFASPTGLFIDRTTSDIFVADREDNRVRFVGCSDRDASNGTEIYDLEALMCVAGTPAP